MDLFEEDSTVLGELSKLHDENSKEYLALKHAGIALWYVLMEGHDKFKEYIATLGSGLTKEQRLHLADMGIDPDFE